MISPCHTANSSHETSARDVTLHLATIIDQSLIQKAIHTLEKRMNNIQCNHEDSAAHKALRRLDTRQKRLARVLRQMDARWFARTRTQSQAAKPEAKKKSDPSNEKSQGRQQFDPQLIRNAIHNAARGRQLFLSKQHFDELCVDLYEHLDGFEVLEITDELLADIAEEIVARFVYQN